MARPSAAGQLYSGFINFRSRANPCISGLHKRTSHATASPGTIDILDYVVGADTPRQPRTMRSPGELLQTLAETSPDLQGRVLLVENPGRDLIDTLGSALDIDPVFFAGHIITDFQEIEKAPPPPSLALLPSRVAEMGFLHVHYQLVIDLGSSDAFKGSVYARKTSSNVPRNVRLLTPLGCRQLALARGCCSIVMRTLGQQWICLMLVDPPIDAVVTSDGNIHPSSPLHCGFEDFATPKPFSSFVPEAHNANNNARVQDKASMRECLVAYLRAQAPPDLSASPHAHRILAFGYYPIRIAVAQWVTYVHLTSRYLKLYEYTLRNIRTRVGSEDNEDLVDLQRWRRRIKQSRHKLLALCDFIRYRLAEQQEQEQEPQEQQCAGPAEERRRYRRSWKPVLADVCHVEAQLKDYGDSLEMMIPVATSMVQLLDARDSLARSTDTTRLTYLALVFVPLSWAASLFSMSDQYRPGGEFFWVYFATALPLLAVLIGTALLANVYASRKSPG